MRHAHIESYVWDLAEEIQDMATHYVLLAIAEKCDWETGETFASAETIARMCFCNERTVRAHVKKLLDLGILELVEAKQGRARILRISGYAETRNRRRTPVNSSGPERDAHPGKSFRLSQGSYSRVASVPSESQYTKGSSIAMAGVASDLPEGVAREASSGDSLDRSPPSPPLPSEIEDYGAGLETPPWEETPPTPIENQTAQPEDEARPVTQAKRVARRVADASEARTISTKDWVEVWAEFHPTEHAAWKDWLDQNGYIAQLAASARRGYLLVPAMDISPDAEDLYRRKFPLANAA